MRLQDFFNNFLETIGTYLPGVIGALAVFIIGWFIAKVLKRITKKLLNQTNLDNRLLKGGSSKISVEDFISKLVYYLILMIVMLIVLEMLGVHNVLDPIKNMVNEFMAYIPNVIAAGIIGFAGYIIASIASEIFGFAGEKLDHYSTKLGISKEMDLGGIIKKIVFIIVFIPLLIAALDALKLTAISEPFKEMLTTFINAIPNILVAGLILAVFYFGGRFITGILGDLLKGLGTDDLTNKLSLNSIVGEDQSLSKLIANVGFFFLMFMGIIASVEKLHFPQFSEILGNLLQLSGQIFFGLIIMVIGNWIANIVTTTLSKSNANTFIAFIARIAVLGLFLAIALRSMGIANEIVNLAFGLTLGSVAVAVALSFGLGGREAAGKQMEYILSKFRNKD